MALRYTSLALLVRAAARWPDRARQPAAQALGQVLRSAGRHRARIARRNLELCLPQLDARARDALLRLHFGALGLGLLDTARVWSGRAAPLLARTRISGLAHLDGAGGVLLLGLHNVTMELAAAALGERLPLDATYRRHADPRFDALQHRARSRHIAALIERRDVRGMVRSLRSGRVLWYAADQDYGADHAVFAPLFGQPAATTTAPLRLARLGRARIAFVEHWRDPVRDSWHVQVHPPRADLPSGDDGADARHINASFEAMIRRHPEQYLWLHRRFKTTPQGLTARY